MRTGVYNITCLPTGKTYVGSAAISFAKRWAQHRHDLRRGRHKSTYMQRSWDKYGEAAFMFAVLERCPPEQAVVREQVWIDELQPKFNTAKVAGSSLGTKRTVVQRARYSEIRSQTNQRLPGKGAAHLHEIVKTEEFRQAQSERVKARHAAGGYDGAHRMRSERQSRKHIVHGEELTLKELAAKYGRTVKALQRRVERGAQGDDIVAPPYAVRRR